MQPVLWRRGNSGAWQMRRRQIRLMVRKSYHRDLVICKRVLGVDYI